MLCPPPPESLWAMLPPAGNGLIGAHRAVLPSRGGHVGELSAPLAHPSEAVAIEFPAKHRAVGPQSTPIERREGNGSEPARYFELAMGFDGGEIAAGRRVLGPIPTRWSVREITGRRGGVIGGSVAVGPGGNGDDDSNSDGAKLEQPRSPPAAAMLRTSTPAIRLMASADCWAPVREFPSQSPTEDTSPKFPQRSPSTELAATKPGTCCRVSTRAVRQPPKIQASRPREIRDTPDPPGKPARFKP